MTKNVGMISLVMFGFNLGLNLCYEFTGNLYKALPRFGDLSSCCCLGLLSQLVCSILTTWKRLM